MLASVVIWLGTSTGFLPRRIGLGPVGDYLGLPVETGPFYLGFRRDYRAAGRSVGSRVASRQLVVTQLLTLFVPCGPVCRHGERTWLGGSVRHGCVRGFACFHCWVGFERNPDVVKASITRLKQKAGEG